MNKIFPSSILIIRLSSIGDVLLTTPLIRILKNYYPDSRIDFMTTKINFDLLKFNPNINILIEYDKSLSINEILKFKDNIIKESNYDLIIDLQNNLRSKILTSAVQAHVYKFNKRRLYKIKLVYFKYKVKDYLQIPDLYVNSLNELSILPDGLGLEFWLKKDLKNKTYPFKEILTSNILKIAIAPGAHHFTKRWTKEKYIELCKELVNKYYSNISLIGGSEDEKLCQEICDSVGTNCQTFAGKISLLDSAEIINDSDLTITNDTSIMHISAARQVPTVAIFGSTIPEFGFSPYMVNNRIVQNDMKCRPCTHIGKKKCPKGHFNCMNTIEVNAVMEAVQSIIE